MQEYRTKMDADDTSSMKSITTTAEYYWSIRTIHLHLWLHHSIV